MKSTKVKCAGCGEWTLISEWKEATIGIVNGRRTFVGGCPVCKGEFYEEEGTDNIISINEKIKQDGESKMKKLTETINHVTAKIEHPELKFDGYEFETEPVYVGDGWSQEVFRLEINKKSGEAGIYCAYTDEFDVSDDVTHLFDVKKIKSAINEYMRRNMTFNYGKNYVKYTKLVEDGMDEREAFEQAITM